MDKKDNTGENNSGDKTAKPCKHEWEWNDHLQERWCKHCGTDYDPHYYLEQEEDESATLRDWQRRALPYLQKHLKKEQDILRQLRLVRLSPFPEHVLCEEYIDSKEKEIEELTQLIKEAE